MGRESLCGLIRYKHILNPPRRHATGSAPVDEEKTPSRSLRRCLQPLGSVEPSSRRFSRGVTFVPSRSAQPSPAAVLLQASFHVCIVYFEKITLIIQCIRNILNERGKGRTQRISLDNIHSFHYDYGSSFQVAAPPQRPD